MLVSPVDCRVGIESILIPGKDLKIVAEKSFSSAANAVTADIAGFKRHLHMFFPFFKYQTLGLAAGVWKTSFLVKLLAVPGFPETIGTMLIWDSVI